MAPAAQAITRVNAMAEAIATFGALVRGAIDDAAGRGDADTVDICTQLAHTIDKSLWPVEAHAAPQVPGR